VSTRTSGVAFAPGRVNLIGEHTDYNEGFVLPLALDQGVTVGYRTTGDRVLRAHTSLGDRTASAALDELDAVPRDDWFAYVAGVARAVGDAGIGVPGVELSITTTLPAGAGLSSSAALEAAVARALLAAAEATLPPADIALLCQRAENVYVGVPCGIMDQMAAALAPQGSALLVDCRSLGHEVVRLPTGAAIVVIDSGGRRELATTAYADRRAACARAVTALRALGEGAASLRDISLGTLSGSRDAIDPEAYRRATHVVNENARVLAFIDALRSADLATAGRLMNESHESLRTLFEVSSEALDAVVGRARMQPGCHGARMTGAGFGGCAVALVEVAEVTRFVAAFGAALLGVVFPSR
jgi:galactokinase